MQRETCITGTLLPRLKMGFGLVHAMWSNGPHYKSSGSQICKICIVVDEKGSRWGHFPAYITCAGLEHCLSYFKLIPPPSLLTTWTRSHRTQAHQVPLPSHEGCGPIDVGGGTTRETQQMEGSRSVSTKPMMKIMGCFVHSLISHPK